MLSGYAALKIVSATGDSVAFCALWVAALCRCLSAGDWVWDWVAQGPRRGHPRATQASRKGGPRVDWDEVLCLQQKLKKGRAGVKKIR
jgi:hypothetical protein